MSKKLNIINTALFMVILLTFSLAFFILPDQSFSEQENRSLRTLPKFTWEKLASGAYGREINDYFADQFPLRDLMVGLKSCSELSLGKGENNGVILGKDGQLQTRLYDAITAGKEVMHDVDCHDPEAVQKAIEGINRAGENLNVPLDVLLTGRTVDVTAASSHYPNTFGEELLEQLRTGISDSVNYIETVPALRQRHEAGECVYYKTDHHWTTLGAYYAYVEIMRSYGMQERIIPMDAFERELASSAFYGTAWSAGGMKHVSPDSLEIWHYGNEDEFAVIADGKELNGFYSREYLSRKDQYSVFLDGTHDVVTIQKAGEERPTLLLLKDSFANSIAPFLAQHFDLVLLNLSSRQNYSDITSLAKEYGADRVLILYTVENVITADKLWDMR